MEILHTSPFDSKSSSLRLVLHRLTRPVPAIRADLPALSPDYLSHFWRNLDDWPADLPVGNYRASLIAEIGLKTSHKGIVTPKLSIPRDVAIMATRNPQGRVAGLIDVTNSRWLTIPQPHVENLVRKQFTRTIEVYDSPLDASVAALERNVAVIALCGFELRQLSQWLIGINSIIIPSAIEVRAAA